MSPRRGGNEESILEMLERDTVRTRGLRAQSRFGWYVSGTVLAVFVVSLLVWLARESPEVRQMEAVLSAADSDHPTTAYSSTDGVAATSRAAIVDEQAASSRTQDSHQQLPPIELATSGLFDPVPGMQSPSKASAVVEDTPGNTPPRPAIALQTPGTDGQGPAGSASAARSLAAGVTRPSNKTQQSVNHQANPRKPARTAGKPKRPITVAASTDTPADSDVALISAVIQHATNRPDPACADAECAAKATPKP